MKITVEYEVTGQMIADLMISAIEGNHMTRSWCEGIFLKWHGKSLSYTGKESWWYADGTLFEDSFVFEVIEITDESLDAPEGRCIHSITASGMRLGIARMAAVARSHFGDWLNDEADGITADVFLQCVVLGEVRYG